MGSLHDRFRFPVELTPISPAPSLAASVTSAWMSVVSPMSRHAAAAFVDAGFRPRLVIKESLLLKDPILGLLARSVSQ